MKKSTRKRIALQRETGDLRAVTLPLEDWSRLLESWGNQIVGSSPAWEHRVYDAISNQLRR